MVPLFRTIIQWLRGRLGVNTVTIYLKGGNVISFDATYWKWNYVGDELKSYSFKYADSESDPMEYIRISEIQAITVSRY